MIVRGRAEDDVEACVALATVIHHLDGYPVFLPTDLRPFLVSSDAYTAWVADDDGEVVGHVALHRRSTDAVMARVTEVLQRPHEQVGVVARLFVAPTARRSGTGEILLDVAAHAARARGLWPVLDVGTELHGAIALYESCGWACAGRVTSEIGGGLTVDEFVYIGPAADGDPPLV